MGTMTMELGGKVSIVCSKTGYTAELEFKLRVSSLSPLRPADKFTNNYFWFEIHKYISAEIDSENVMPTYYVVHTVYTVCSHSLTSTVAA